jgi:hypothetical protein
MKKTRAKFVCYSKEEDIYEGMFEEGAEYYVDFVKAEG